MSFPCNDLAGPPAAPAGIDLPALRGPLGIDAGTPRAAGVKGPAFTLWTHPEKTRCLEDTASRGLLFLTGHLEIIGCFFHGHGYGQIRLFHAGHFTAPPYLMGRRAA